MTPRFGKALMTELFVKSRVPKTTEGLPIDLAKAIFTVSIVAASAFFKTAGTASASACAVVWQAVKMLTQSKAQYRKDEIRMIIDPT